MTVLLLIYRYAFGAGGGGDYGAATALSLMLAAFLAVFSALYFRADATVGDDVVTRRGRRHRRAGRSASAPGAAAPRRRRARGGDAAVGERGVRLGHRAVASGRSAGPSRGVHGLLLAFLVVVGLGPLLWLAKSSVSTTQDTLRHPMSLWPSGIDLENLSVAWNDAEIGHYFFNTVKVAIGSWLVQLVVAVTGGYVLGILKPWYAGIVTGAGAGDAVHPAGRAARAAVRDRARPAVRRVVAAQQLLGRVAAGGRQRVQRAAGQAVLREHARSS